MIVAGDTCEGLVEPVEALRTAVPEPVEIAAVAGNHEFYSRHHAAELAAGRQRATEIGVHLVENDVAYSGHLRVIGATLWTDHLLFGAGMRPPAMREALDRIRDRIPGSAFARKKPSILHNRSAALFEAELSKKHYGPTMPVGHHGLIPEALDQASVDRSLLAAAYTSDWSSLIERFTPDYVVSGHTHCPMNFRRGPTRVISNPRGYPGEGVKFDPLFTIEMPYV